MSEILPKPNHCLPIFACAEKACAEKNKEYTHCAYNINKVYGCKYHSEGYCASTVAQINMMYVALTQAGVLNQNDEDDNEDT